MKKFVLFHFLFILLIAVLLFAMAACDKDNVQETPVPTGTEQTGTEQTGTEQTGTEQTGTAQTSTGASEGLHYQINADKTAYRVIGLGICSDLDVVIPATHNGLPVTSIGDYAFNDGGCSYLTSVTIPGSVTSIDDYAFYKCTGLTSVTIGNGVTSIVGGAFHECYKLVEVYNQSSLTITKGSTGNGYVGYYAKNIYTTPGGSKLSTDANGYILYTDGADKILIGYTGSGTELVLPSDITEIYQYAFYQCTGLASITIPNGVTSIGDRVFSRCTGLTSITIPDSVTSVGDSAFYNCTGLTSVTIGNGVTSIGSSAFSGCRGLTSVTFTNTSGWYRTNTEGASSGTDMTVTDASTNATNLKSSYDYYWYRK